MEKFIEIIISNKIYISISIALIGLLIYVLIKDRTNELEDKSKKINRLNKKKKTYLKLLTNIIKYLIILIVIIIILQMYGINVNSIAAGLGVVSVIVGLALQDALKDIIMGFNIVVDNYFAVGDVIKIHDFEGKVIEIGLKSTKIKDIYNSHIYVIANRDITSAMTKSNQFDIDIPLPYEKNLELVENIIKSILEKLSDHHDISGVQYKGINDFGSSAIFYKIRIFCNPELQPQVARDARRLIKLELDNNKISIPYTQIDIHNK